uniref:uncharacterized protein LOC105349606 n=1 Tax=Fragaria vesca subsp. vesca TaxID=101020 RepID=UPI0005CAEB17|nr:PREDICTED: uncharacterized protein LOC105349606 [Fragaria vesca subsp. vesca]
MRKRFASISTSGMTILQRKKRRFGGRISGHLRSMKNHQRSMRILSEIGGCVFGVDNVNVGVVRLLRLLKICKPLLLDADFIRNAYSGSSGYAAISMPCAVSTLFNSWNSIGGC